MKSIVHLLNQGLKDMDLDETYVAHKKDDYSYEIKKWEENRGLELRGNHSDIFDIHDHFLMYSSLEEKKMLVNLLKETIVKAKENLYFVEYKKVNHRDKQILIPHGEKAKKLWNCIKDLNENHVYYDYQTEKFILKFPFMERFCFHFNFENERIKIENRASEVWLENKKEVEEFYEKTLKENVESKEVAKKIKGILKSSSPTNTINLETQQYQFLHFRDKFTLERIIHDGPKYTLKMGKIKIEQEEEQTLLKKIKKIIEKQQRQWLEMDEEEKRKINYRNSEEELHYRKFIIETFGTFRIRNPINNEQLYAEIMEEIKKGYKEEEINFIQGKEKEKMIETLHLAFQEEKIGIAIFRNYILLNVFNGLGNYIEMYRK